MLIEGSDPYAFYETDYQYAETGEPAYAVFRNVDYDNPENLETMDRIAAEMTSTLSFTVQSPVYSWVGPFQNYITAN